MPLSTLSILSSAAGAAADSPPAIVTFAPMIVIVLAMWFLFLRPQMQQQKAQRAKIDGLKKNDSVLTGGGIVGKVVSVDDDYCNVEIAPGMKVKVLKSTITDIIPPGGKPAND